MKDCLTQEQIAEKLQPGKDAQALLSMLRHVAECDQCRQRLLAVPGVQTAAASLASGVRRAAPAACLSYERLRAALTGGGTAAEQAAIAAHLGECPQCREDLASLRQLSLELSYVARPSLPRSRPRVWLTVQEALRRPLVRPVVAWAAVAVGAAAISIGLVSPLPVPADAVYAGPSGPLWSPGMERAMLLIGWGSVIACGAMLLATLRSREKTIPPAWVEATGPQRRFVVVISEPKASLGRSPGNQIVLDTPEVSRRHAEIAWNGKTFLVTDLGSRNGTRLNGQRIDTAALADGDRLEIGTWALVFARGQWGPDHSD